MVRRAAVSTPVNATEPGILGSVNNRADVIRGFEGVPPEDLVGIIHQAKESLIDWGKLSLCGGFSVGRRHPLETDIVDGASQTVAGAFHIGLLLTDLDLLTSDVGRFPED